MRTTLEADDVVFMYLPKEDEALVEYGATVCAWGDAHTLKDVRRLNALGVHPTGSMWCLTAGSDALHHSPDLREATVRDIAGEPIAVPWLPERSHADSPNLWGCTNHPTYRAHLRKTVATAMAGGAAGLHVDDHLGTAHPAFAYGGCFCDFCVSLFREHLRGTGSQALRTEAGVASFDGFDYRALVRQLAATRELYIEKQATIPLHGEYVNFQLLRAAENVRQLARLAGEIVGHPITLSANTVLPLLEHVVVTPYLTHLVGEVEHSAGDGTGHLLNAVRAYRMAEALGKPMASTASGTDWAHIKSHHAHNLVKLWIGLSYSCGQRLMSPQKAWCYVPGVGTQWYHGPTSAFAPFYRFVRSHGRLLRGYRTIGPLAPPHGVPGSFDTPQSRRELQSALARGNPEPLRAGDDVWLFPRQSPDGAAVIHVLNLAYDPSRDAVRPREQVPVRLPRSLFARGFTSARWHSVEDGEAPVALGSGDDVSVTLPRVRTWGIVELG